MRAEYDKSHSSALGNRIRQAEVQIESTRKEVRQLFSELHKALGK